MIQNVKLTFGLLFMGILFGAQNPSFAQNQFSPNFSGPNAAQSNGSQENSSQQHHPNPHAFANQPASVQPTSNGQATSKTHPTQVDSQQPHSSPTKEEWGIEPNQWLAPEGLGNSLKVMILVTVVSLVPGVLLMTTCFVRIVVVFGILKQAIGLQQLPPNQVITSLALFMSLLVMTPVWQQAYEEGVTPYMAKEISLEEAWKKSIQPVRRFMSLQIERTGNTEDIWLFMDYVPYDKEPETYEEVPLTVLIPAFMLSELKTAFLIGFQIYLPFIILDMVVSSVMISMGMLMLPPTTISLPLKLLLFVLVDGWHLIVGMLLESFQGFTPIT